MAALRMLGRAKKRNRGTILVDSSSVSTTDEIIDEESSLASVAELGIKEEDEEAGKKAEEKLLVVDRAIREGKNEMETQLIVEELEKKWDKDNPISEL